MLGFHAARICGRSMEPALYHGDLAIGRGPSHLQPGLVVLVELRGVGLSVKRLGQPDGQGRFALVGDSPLSAPSVDLGRVEADEVLAVLRWVWRGKRLRKIA